jgi:large conductance mechanosensitive channel
MKWLTEFKEFAVKGNAFDLAVGVIMGAAFGKIVDSTVADLIMPNIAALLGGRVDFSSLYIVLGTIPEGVANTLDSLKKAGIPVFAYGNFITVLVNFTLLAAVVFILVRYVNRIKNQLTPPIPTQAPALAPNATETLLTEIRDELRRQIKQG